VEVGERGGASLEVLGESKKKTGAHEGGQVKKRVKLKEEEGPLSEKGVRKMDVTNVRERMSFTSKGQSFAKSGGWEKETTGSTPGR